VDAAKPQCRFDCFRFADFVERLGSTAGQRRCGSSIVSGRHVSFSISTTIFAKFFFLTDWIRQSYRHPQNFPFGGYFWRPNKARSSISGPASVRRGWNTTIFSRLERRARFKSISQQTTSNIQSRGGYELSTIWFRQAQHVITGVHAAV